MEEIAIVTYVVCDDVVKNLKIREDIQSKMSLAEVMTTAIIAASEFSGNIEKARRALGTKHYIPNMLSKSQLNRRLHNIDEYLWNCVLKELYMQLKENNLRNEFIVDSAPISACKLSRQGRNKIFSEKKYLGYCASQKEYFVGIKINIICGVNGMPIELLLTPGAMADILSFKKMKLELPRNSRIYADKAYNDYTYEDMLVQKRQIHILPIRKKNSRRKGSGYTANESRKKRKKIETVFSCIAKLMPRSIHAVTKKGFKLKTLLFVLAYAFTKVI